MDAADISKGIVEISRKARFEGVTPDEWQRRLEAFLAAQSDVSAVIAVDDVRPVAEAAGGSNGTMLFRARYQSEIGHEDRRLVLRFLPERGLFHHYDVTEQFRLQRALGESAVPVPKQLWLDSEGTYLGRPGYVMERAAGVSTPMAWMASGILHDAPPEGRRAMSRGYVRALADIHALDWKSLGLDWMRGRAKGARPVERETNWYWDALVWSGNTEYIRQLAPVRQWLIENEPDGMEEVLCHGDANFGNYLYVGTELSAVLDWEMSFLGPRECDLAYLKIGDSILQDGVPWPEGVLTYEEMRAEYERSSGYTLRHMEYFELFAGYRMAVINVLAMKHFPSEVLSAYEPVLRRGPELCRAQARALGVTLE
ncbi:phosphotransferase family protein [Hyphomonas sp. NPDC076900]|uniref:phosphotransferase family protein n=1 Tax=unclassified Hyphomonas TaxID=2630699 RepID=UPI003D03CBBC